MSPTGGQVYFVAETQNPAFAVPAGAASTVYSRGYVGCLAANGSALVAATFLPGTPTVGRTPVVLPTRLALDAAGNVYVSGKGIRVGRTPGGYVAPSAVTLVGGLDNYFISKLNAGLTRIVQTAVLAGGDLANNLPLSLGIDPCGNAIVSSGLASTLPVNPYPLINLLPGGGVQSSFYIAALDNTLSQVLFGSYYGTSVTISQPGYNAATDPQGRVYVPILTVNYNGTYPTLPTAYLPAPLPSAALTAGDVVGLVIDPQLALTPRATLIANAPVCLGQAVQLASTSTGAGRIRWDFGDGSPRDSVNASPQHTYPRPGTYRVRLLARPAPGSCARPDTTSALVRVGAPAVRALLPRVYLCPGQPAVTLDAGNPGSTYAWNTGATSQTIQASQPGTYVVAIRTPCGRVDTARVLVPAPPRLVRDSLACAGVVTLRVADPDPAATYLWSTGATTPALAVTEPGRYTLAVSVGGCRFALAAVAAPAGAVPTVPNVFTPGPGDALNATFQVPGLPPGSRLRVYSRWGSLVYEAADYRNTWDAAGLAAGTYYYLLENARFCQSSTYKGWVEVIR